MSHSATLCDAEGTSQQTLFDMRLAALKDSLIELAVLFLQPQACKAVLVLFLV